jgi:hypothetical protein
VQISILIQVFYLRFFYTEEQQGWDSEEWLKYRRWTLPIILVIIVVSATIFLLLR